MYSSHASISMKLLWFEVLCCRLPCPTVCYISDTVILTFKSKLSCFRARYANAGSKRCLILLLCHRNMSLFSVHVCTLQDCSIAVCVLYSMFCSSMCYVFSCVFNYAFFCKFMPDRLFSCLSPYPFFKGTQLCNNEYCTTFYLTWLSNCTMLINDSHVSNMDHC